MSGAWNSVSGITSIYFVTATHLIKFGSQLHKNDIYRLGKYMPTQAVTKQCAQAALEQILRDSEPAKVTRDKPFEYLHVLDTKCDATEEVKNQWFSVSSLT